MKTDHAELRRMVLMLEDLDDAERRVAADHLAGCDACARLREGVLRAEGVARAVAGLPAADDDPLAGLSEAERAQARASLGTLLAGGGAAGARRRLLHRVIPLALAAAAALLILLPGVGERTPVQDLQIGSPLVLRGAPGSPATIEHGLSFRLRHDGFPVVLHVDGAGTVRLIHPSPGSPPRKWSQGERVLLPSPDRQAVWRSALTPGCETYLLAIATKHAPTAADLAALAALPPAAGRDEAVRAASRRLGELVGTVARRDAAGCP
ncbi:MAG: hypothetical protein R3D98_00575 [Candidatus Krumholzibacteriia bacterium]